MFWVHGDSYGGAQGKFAGWEDPKVKLGENVPKHKKPERYQKCLLLQNFRLVLSMIDRQGWILRNVIVFHKKNALPSSAKDRFKNAWEPIFMLTKNRHYYFDLEAVSVPLAESSIKRAQSPCYPDHWKAKLWRETQPQGGRHPQTIAKEVCTKIADGTKTTVNPGDVWSFASEVFPDAHFAVFPSSIVDKAIRAACPQWVCKECGRPRERIIEYLANTPKCATRNRGGRQDGSSQGQGKPPTPKQIVGWTNCRCNAGWNFGIVLDPFMGSGTVAVVAKKLQRHYIGFEINPEYVEMANKRLERECGLLF